MIVKYKLYVTKDLFNILNLRIVITGKGIWEFLGLKTITNVKNGLIIVLTFSSVTISKMSVIFLFSYKTR